MFNGLAFGPNTVNVLLNAETRRIWEVPAHKSVKKIREIIKF